MESILEELIRAGYSGKRSMVPSTLVAEAGGSLYNEFWASWGYIVGNSLKKGEDKCGLLVLCPNIFFWKIISNVYYSMVNDNIYMVSMYMLISEVRMRFFSWSDSKYFRNCRIERFWYNYSTLFLQYEATMGKKESKMRKQTESAPRATA